MALRRRVVRNDTVGEYKEVLRCISVSIISVCRHNIRILRQSYIPYVSEIQQVEQNVYDHVVIANDETKNALKVIFHEMLDELDTGMPMEEFDKIFDQRFPPKF